MITNFIDLTIPEVVDLTMDSDDEESVVVQRPAAKKRAREDLLEDDEQTENAEVARHTAIKQPMVLHHQANIANLREMYAARAEERARLLAPIVPSPITAEQVDRAFASPIRKRAEASARYSDITEIDSKGWSELGSTRRVPDAGALVIPETPIEVVDPNAEGCMADGIDALISAAAAKSTDDIDIDDVYAMMFDV